MRGGAGRGGAVCGPRGQTGVVLNVISCFLLAGYTAAAFEGVYGEPPFALPAWAAAAGRRAAAAGGLGGD